MYLNKVFLFGNLTRDPEQKSLPNGTGRITTRSWDDKTTGEKKYRTEIVADAVQFGPKSSGAPVADGFAGNPAPVTPKGASTTPDLDTIDYGDSNINIDDIPF